MNNKSTVGDRDLLTVADKAFNAMLDRIEKKGRTKTFVKLPVTNTTEVRKLDKMLIDIVSAHNQTEVANNKTDKLLQVNDNNDSVKPATDGKCSFGVSVVKIISEKWAVEFLTEQVAMFNDAHSADDIKYGGSLHCFIEDPEGVHLNRDTLLKVAQDNPSLLVGEHVQVKVKECKDKYCRNCTDIGKYSKE